MAKKIDSLDELLNQFHMIEADTLSINEDNANPQNSDGDLDADLDALLKNEKDVGDANGDVNAVAAPEDNAGEEKKDEEDPLAGLDAGGEEKNAAAATNVNGDNNFATDSEGLMDTITKLTKAGHTVKIVVSAEGQQMFSIDGKKATLKQLNELLTKSVNGGDKMSPEMKAMSEQISKLTDMVAKLQNNNNETIKAKPITEDKIIKIKESNYNMLTEMVQDLKYKVDEQEALIKNYESLKGFADLNENDQDISKIIQEMSSAVDELNKHTTDMKLYNASNKSYNIGSDISLGIMTESILPILNEVVEAKSNALNMIDITNYTNKADTTNVFDKEKVMNLCGAVSFLEALDSHIFELEKVNLISRYNNLINTAVSNVLAENKKLTRGDFQMILDEAASDIIIVDGDSSIDGAPNNFPTYETFDKRVKKLLQDAFNKSDKSDITVRDEDDTIMPRSQMRKFDLPITTPEKWNANITIKSAMTNLQEALTDVDGNVDLALCEQAYLYKRTKTPHSIKDFAFPIAVMNFQEHKLYAHPTLIENVAKILKNESCMRTYDIKSRQDLYDLRESLMPYLKKIGIDAPWETTKLPEKLTKETKEETKK